MNTIYDLMNRKPDKAFIKVFIILLFLCFHLCDLFAYDFENEGLCYNILPNGEIEITYKNINGGSYSGGLNIPEKVLYNDKEYVVSSIGTKAFYKCSGLTGPLIIPNSITSIEESAFDACSGFTGDLTIPNSVKSIGKWAFFGCSGLKGTLTISDGVENIEEGAFASCRGLTGNLVIPNSVKSIGKAAFRYCSGFNGTLTISESVKTIEEQTFYLCKGFIGSLTIPNSVISVDKEAFYGCSGFTGPLNISNSVASIGDHTFSGCSGIAGSLTIPNSVTSIKDYAFHGCSGLLLLSIPNSVTSIGSFAFAGCSKLSLVISEIKTPFALKSVFYKINSIAKLQVPQGTKSLYETCSGWTSYFSSVVEYDEENTCNFIISGTGNGVVSYSGSKIKNVVKLLSVEKGVSVKVIMTPDTGFRIGNVIINNLDVTSQVVNNELYIGNISRNTSLSVLFEEIPLTDYTLTIESKGNGTATYDNSVIRSTINQFTIKEGSNVVVSFQPDTGNRIKKIMHNSTNVTASVFNSQYTINNISSDNMITVEFEETPQPSNTLTIVASGYGNVSYDGSTIRNQSKDFSVAEGNDIVLSLTPDNGYRVGSVKMNNSDVTGQVADGKLTISKVASDIKVEVTFEEIPPTTYLLTISSTGNGSATYEATEIRNKSQQFTVVEGIYATISIAPDNGYRLKSVKVDNSDVTSAVINNQLTTSKIMQNTTVAIEFVEDITEVTEAGVNYKVASYEEQTLLVSSGDYGQTMTVPANISAKGKEWKVVGVEANALNSSELAAIIWNPNVAFDGTISNPNLLLYVKDKAYAPNTIKNVIVNGEADEIILTDAESGNNFYCPQAFTAKKVSYEHNYSMTSGYKTCQGWETIVLPFDVSTILNATAQELVPYKVWNSNSSQRLFWLHSLTAEGWKEAESIKANTPYIISMPNNENYDASYNQSGNIQFIGNNVQIKGSDNLINGKIGNKNLVPNYQNHASSSAIYALNVNNLWNKNSATEVEGSTFIRSLRPVRPFEAYMTVEGSSSSALRAIPINETPTGIFEMEDGRGKMNDAVWYTLDGRKLQGKPTAKGLYIINGRKVVVK